MGLVKEFKEFAIKGNVVDMSVGIVIGAAFTAIVQSGVKDLLEGPLGLLTGGLSFNDRFFVLRPGKTPEPYATLADARGAGAAVLAWGNFVQAIISFLLVSLVLFFVVRWINSLRRPDTPPAPDTKSCPRCLSNIPLKATRCPHCTSELASEPG